MSLWERILALIAGLFMVMLFLLMLFGHHGVGDLNTLQRQRDLLLEQTATLRQENQGLHRAIERLTHDPQFIESIAREELRMIGKGEIVLKIEKDGTSPNSPLRSDNNQYVAPWNTKPSSKSSQP